MVDSNDEKLRKERILRCTVDDKNHELERKIQFLEGRLGEVAQARAIAIEESLAR